MGPHGLVASHNSALQVQTELCEESGESDKIRHAAEKQYSVI